MKRKSFKSRRMARTRAGGIRSAAYQRKGKRTRRIREKSSRRAARPSTSQVKTIPTRLGPRSMAGNIRMPAIFGRGWPCRRCGAATSSAASQETANVNAK